MHNICHFANILTIWLNLIVPLNEKGFLYKNTTSENTKQLVDVCGKNQRQVMAS